MICDLCKPMNEGEGPVVKITMTVPEAQAFLSGSEEVCRAVTELRTALQRAIKRAVAERGAQ